VQQATAHGALAGEFIEFGKINDRLYCKECNSHRVFRIFRKGFLQERIYPWFGFYPWKCKDCKSCMFYRKRKMSRAKQRESLA